MPIHHKDNKQAELTRVGVDSGAELVPGHVDPLGNISSLAVPINCMKKSRFARTLVHDCPPKAGVCVARKTLYRVTRDSVSIS